MSPPSTASPGLTKTVALEVAEVGITVNAICPGYVLTPLVEKQIPDTAKARGITEAQVVKDVLLAAQPTKQFVDCGASRIARRLSRRGWRGFGLRVPFMPIDGGWTA